MCEDCAATLRKGESFASLTPAPQTKVRIHHHKGGAYMGYELLWKRFVD